MSGALFKKLLNMSFNYKDQAPGSEFNREAPIFEGSNYIAENVRSVDDPEVPVYTGQAGKTTAILNISEWTHGPEMSKIAEEKSATKVYIEPETVRTKLPLISEEQFNRLMAKHIVENTNAPFENFRYFAATVVALNGIVPNFNIIESPDVPQIWYALKIFRNLRPNMELSEEVQIFIKLLSNEEGYYIYPPECELFFDTEYMKKIEDLAVNGPFPLGETTDEIQAARYLEIQSYINRMHK